MDNWTFSYIDHLYVPKEMSNEKKQLQQLTDVTARIKMQLVYCMYLILYSKSISSHKLVTFLSSQAALSQLTITVTKKYVITKKFNLVNHNNNYN